MPEIAPRLTYSPDGILELNQDFSANSAEDVEQFLAKIENLNELPGCEVTSENGAVSARIDIDESLHDSFNSSGNPKIAKFISLCGPLLYMSHEDPRDGVFSLDWWSEHGADGQVYPHFQRWLNQGGPDETTARLCLEAMALPFGKGDDGITINPKNVGYNQEDGQMIVQTNDLRLFAIIRLDDFGLNDYDETDTTISYKSGRGKWSWLDMSTLGDCACWGVSGDTRSNVFMPGVITDSQRLYNMLPHNVENARQSLSLVLGIGALAHAASQYEGTEDIYADIEWRVTSSRDKQDNAK